jgi:hypothetical protein
MQRLLPEVAFRKLVKALHGEQTFLMRVAIDGDTDVNAILRYWGKGGRAEALRPLLESMAKVPGGGSINISLLLPWFARARLYTFPQGSNGPNENCFWTAMNFFSEKPDPRFVEFKYVKAVLEGEYEPVREPPVYGDLLLVTGADGDALHMCVYLADDVVFTKNGKDQMQPWVLMKIPDMLTYYSSRTPAHLTVYRAKTPSCPSRPGSQSSPGISAFRPQS